jgi:single-strand DNA-binding protein
MNTITVTGYVGTEPELKRMKNGMAWTQFRVADCLDGEPTMWFKVKVTGCIAENVVDSLRKGTPVIVTGRLAQEPYIVTSHNDDGEQVSEYRNGLTIEDAIIGIDLFEGAARYVRNHHQPAAEAA